MIEMFFEDDQLSLFKEFMAHRARFERLLEKEQKLQQQRTKRIQNEYDEAIRLKKLSLAKERNQKVLSTS